jgi:lysophospholipase L1-like esterase
MLRLLFAVSCLSFGTAHEWLNDVGADLACSSAAVNHSKIVVAAVGDSITVGATCNTWKGGFVKILADTLDPEKYDVRDCGLCGHDAVRKGHGNVHHATYWDTSFFTESQKMKPDVVIFMLGTNDADEWYNTSKYFSQDYKDLANVYINLPNKPKVHTMRLPPFGNSTCASKTCAKGTGGAGTDHNCVIDCIMPDLIPSLTTDLGLPAPVDLFKLFGGPDHTNKTVMPGLHPNCAGYTVIGHYLAKELFGVGAPAKKL